MKQLVQGHGFNDVDEPTWRRVNGKRVRDPFYVEWKDMLRRAYDPKYHERRPTYLQTTIDPDWLFFSVFQEWMQAQDWQGKELDKDILTVGNKHYCAEECCFVPRAVNLLLTDSAASRGKWPQGVTLDKASQKFRARIRINGKSKHLCYRDTSEAAADVYNAAKAAYIAIAAKEYASDKRIYDGLMGHAAIYLEKLNSY